MDCEKPPSEPRLLRIVREFKRIRAELPKPYRWLLDVVVIVIVARLLGLEPQVVIEMVKKFR